MENIIKQIEEIGIELTSDNINNIVDDASTKFNLTNEMQDFMKFMLLSTTKEFKDDILNKVQKLTK